MKHHIAIGLAALALLAGCATAPEVSGARSSSTRTQPQNVAGESVESVQGIASAKASAEPQEATTPEGAIEEWLSQQGITYAGRCDQTTNPDDLGKYCSAVAEDRGDMIVAKVGNTFSEYSSYLLIQRTENGWLVVRDADIPAPSEEPSDEVVPF